MAFIITSCMLLFLSQLEQATGISYHAGNVRAAVVLTFSNVILSSLLCTVVDAVRRIYMIDRPVKKIIRAAGRIMQGDFHVRIWEKKNIDIETELEEDVTVCADPELLGIIWNNLFSNAFKFTPEGGRVWVTLAADNGNAVITVTDTGCGMSAETGARIFEKFYQGDTSHAAKGNGLGLALVKRIVEILGGDISVTSEIGKGSRFEVKVRRAVDGEVEEAV